MSVRRVALVLVLAVLALVAAEGALSLACGRSLRGWFAARDAKPASAGDAEPTDDSAPARSATPGPYRLPDDPLVAYTLPPAAELPFREGAVEMRVRTDELGMRARPGPAPDDAALRIVVLGDSVAFGFGLAEDETLAAQLERALAASGAARPVACFTVAVPSWNTRNAWRFLLDHLDHYRPDVVLYLPVPNDLDDSYGVNEAGRRRAGDDPAVPEPLLSVRASYLFLSYRAGLAAKEGRHLDEATFGPEVLHARLTETSRWRLADFAHTLARASARLERTGAHVALAPTEESDFARQIEAELARENVAVPVIPLLRKVEKADTLGVDPHPSAATIGAYAAWIAEALLERGWVTAGANRRTPEVPAGYAARRAPAHAADELLAWSRAYEERTLASLQATVSPEDLRGTLQIYGGLNLDGSMGPRFACALPRTERVRVRLAGLDACPGLYPLEVDVRVDGRELGTLTVEGTGPAEAVFDVAAGAGGAMELTLAARDWAVVTVRGKSWVAAATVLALEGLGR